MPKLIFLVPHQQREIRYINVPQIVGVSHDKEGRRGRRGRGRGVSAGAMTGQELSRQSPVP